MEQRKPGNKGDGKDGAIIKIPAGCGDSHVYLAAKDWEAKRPYDDGTNGSRGLQGTQKRNPGCENAASMKDIDRGSDYLGKIVPMVEVRTGPYIEEPKEPIESVKARVQKAVDRAMECVSTRTYDSPLMDEMYVIQRDEKDRLPGMTVKRSGVDIDATRALCEMQDCLLRMIAPLPPW